MRSANVCSLRLGSLVSGVVLIALVGCGDSGSSSGGGTSSGGSAPTGGAASTGGEGTGASGAGTSVGAGDVGGAGGGGPSLCSTSADCAGDPGGPVCNPATGACVLCTPEEDVCPSGQFCEAPDQCSVGCTDNTDCTAPTVCDPVTNGCVGCNSDDECSAGTVCIFHNCAPGCTPTHDCQAGATCCGSNCFDLQNDPDHCNACDNDCPVPDNSIDVCNGGMCGMGVCDSGWLDCNGDITDGCEHNELDDGPCLCSPGATQPCYYGAPGTQNVGPCHAGTQTCAANGTSWGACVGQVMPISEVCGNNVDDDCDGTTDNAPDADGDGWTYCNGDCNDGASLVNPGAFEVLNDGIDNDCDPASSDLTAPAACSTVAKFTGVTGTNLANAMDLCQTTTANPPLASKKWGLISATQVLADGTPVNTAQAQNQQSAVTTLFGTTIGPKKGATMGIISSGMARDANDAGWVLPISGTSLTSAIAFPGAGPLATYLNAHAGNLLPGQCAGVNCAVGTGANDSISLRLTIRVPTNAQGFSYDFRFFSAEYQSFQCTTFNDYYLAILQSGVALPADHNISFDALGNAVSVNNGFFQDCGGNGKNCGPCPFGTGALAGTGFDQVAGGATEWLTTDAPVVPGETITLDLMVFDVQDHIYDTLVLLDNFRWSLSAVVLGTHT